MMIHCARARYGAGWMPGRSHMAEKQFLVDLERQRIAAQVLQGKHLVAGNRKHPHAAPFVVFPRAGQARQNAATSASLIFLLITTAPRSF